MTTEEKGFLLALKKDPNDATARGAFADWLDEHNRQYEAALQRGKAGLSDVYYKIRRKSDGQFSTGTGGYRAMKWSEGGKMWRRLGDLHSHMRGVTDGKTYGGSAWSNLEVIFVEVRVTYTAALPIKQEQVGDRTRPTVVEPLGPDAGEK